MARDTTADYTVTAEAIIDSAYEELNLVTDGGTISAVQDAYGLKKLNLIIKNIMSPENRLYRGVKVWQRASAELTLTAKNNFDIYSGGTDLDLIAPVRILTAVLRDEDDEDVMLEKMTRGEYDAIAIKGEEGTPTKYLYEREYEYGTLYLNRIPDDLTDSVVFTYHRPLFDVDTAAKNVDFPQQWELVLVYLLAVNMAPRYGIDPSPYMRLLEEARENANTFEPEASTRFFEPGRER